MNIKTEFNLNQIVFYMDQGTITSSRVNRIETFSICNGLTTPPPIHIIYTVMNNEGERINLSENHIFLTKGDLLKCLESEAIDLSDCNYPQ